MKTDQLRELLVMILPSDKKHTAEFIDRCVENATRLNLIELSPKEEIDRLLSSIISEDGQQLRAVRVEDLKRIKNLLQEIK